MNGAVAQLGERRTCTAEVAGSIPVSSTSHPTSVVNAQAVLQANSRPPRWVAHNYVVVPEWLRGWIANPLFVGSIPTHHSKKNCI